MAKRKIVNPFYNYNDRNTEDDRSMDIYRTYGPILLYPNEEYVEILNFAVRVSAMVYNWAICRQLEYVYAMEIRFGVSYKKTRRQYCMMRESLEEDYDTLIRNKSWAGIDKPEFISALDSVTPDERKCYAKVLKNTLRDAHHSFRMHYNRGTLESLRCTKQLHPIILPLKTFRIHNGRVFSSLEDIVSDFTHGIPIHTREYDGCGGFASIRGKKIIRPIIRFNLDNYCLFMWYSDKKKPLRAPKTGQIGIYVGLPTIISASMSWDYNGECGFPGIDEIFDQIRVIDGKLHHKYKYNPDNMSPDTKSKKCLALEKQRRKLYRKLVNIRRHHVRLTVSRLLKENPERVVLNNVDDPTGIMYTRGIFYGIYETFIYIRQKCEKYNIPCVVADSDYDIDACAICGSRNVSVKLGDGTRDRGETRYRQDPGSYTFTCADCGASGPVFRNRAINLRLYQGKGVQVPIE